MVLLLLHEPPNVLQVEKKIFKRYIGRYEMVNAGQIAPILDEKGNLIIQFGLNGFLVFG
jgi:hypothetical protein